MPAHLIKFPRTWGNRMPRDAQTTANMVSDWTAYDHNRERTRCANGMPGHPPCRSVAALIAQFGDRIGAAGDVTADRSAP